MKHELKNTNEDQTREIREIISENDVIDFEGKAITHGMLPEDLEKDYEPYGFIGDVGAGKIIPIHNRYGLIIKGGEFYNPEVTFPYDKEFSRRHHITAENAFIEIQNCNNISLIGQKYTGPNDVVRESTGYPHFRSKYEYDHVIDISESENVLIKDWDASNAFGDFVYFRKGIKRSKNITIKDCKANFIARQGVGFGDGENILIENFELTLGGRGFVDVEPPKQGYEVINLIVRNSPMADVWLLPAPMGGLGTAENILFENNIWTTGGPNTHMDADRVNSFRRNIIFRGNKRLSGYGTDSGGVISAVGVEGLLIENEFAYLKERRALTIAHLDNCTNVTIRNSDFPNAKYIVLKDTPIEEVKVYGNVQKDLEFKIYEFDMPFKPAPSLEAIRIELEKEGITRNSLVWQAWLTEREEWFDYNVERNSRATFKYVPVEEYTGEEPVYQDPDFIPYMGVDTVETEPEKPTEPEPTPEEPTDPTPEPEESETPVEEGGDEVPGFPEEESEEDTEVEEVEKTWYKNKALWVLGAIALILIIIALL